MPKSKALLVIMDGIAERGEIFGNAVKQAKTPNLHRLRSQFPNILLNASGEAVGLPEGQMGNSEVGHLNIGSGRVVYTGLSLINKEVRDGSFFTNDAFQKAINHVRTNKTKLHIMGLLSRGGVHSSFEHIIALVQLANSNNVEAIVHCFSDGRDVDQKSFEQDIKEFTETIGTRSAKLGVIAGRYYAMDRDQRWERVEKAYMALIGRGNIFYSDPAVYVSDSYINGIYDEFLLPAMNSNSEVDELKIDNGDAVIFANFRPDRARELSHCFHPSEIYQYKPQHLLSNIFLVTLTNYEGIKADAIAYPPIDLNNVLGQVIQDNGLSQLRIAETEKYAHVTFFFDGGREFNYDREEKILIPSPKVATYDLQPEMSAPEITRQLVDNMANFDLIIVNYANGDMVGHTGNLPAAIKAVETVDEQIGVLFENAVKNGFTMFVTADHGNADEMLTPENEPITKHSTNLVPFIMTSNNSHLATDRTYSLSSIAPTILEVMGIEIPKEMTSPSMLIKNSKL